MTETRFSEKVISYLGHYMKADKLKYVSVGSVLKTFSLKLSALS